MTTFKINLGKIKCPRCQESMLDVMAFGKLYKNGSAVNVIVSIYHDLDRYEVRRVATPDEVKKFQEIASSRVRELAAKEFAKINKKVDWPEYTPRDPSEANRFDHNEETNKQLTPMFGE